MKFHILAVQWFSPYDKYKCMHEILTLFSWLILG